MKFIQQKASPVFTVDFYLNEPLFKYIDDDIINDTIPNVMFNHSAFVGKTWHDVIESVLYATGMVLRYVGGNKILLATIRDIPLYDKSYHWDVPIIDVRFSAYGHRELTPAAKKMIDDVQFEINDNIADNSMPAEAYGEKGEYTAYIGTIGQANASVWHNRRRVECAKCCTIIIS